MIHTFKSSLISPFPVAGVALRQALWLGAQLPSESQGSRIRSDGFVGGRQLRQALRFSLRVYDQLTISDRSSALRDES